MTNSSNPRSLHALAVITDEFATEPLQLIGVRDISVPILGPNGDAVAVVTCPYLQRVDRETADEASALAELESLASSVSVS